jgi:hypothetical protein
LLGFAPSGGNRDGGLVLVDGLGAGVAGDVGVGVGVAGAVVGVT